jgi:hypothetical protein
MINVDVFDDILLLHQMLKQWLRIYKDQYIDQFVELIQDQTILMYHLELNLNLDQPKSN